MRAFALRIFRGGVAAVSGVPFFCGGAVEVEPISRTDVEAKGEQPPRWAHWTARNLSPALVYKLNTLLCLLSLISRMHSARLRLQTCQGTVTTRRLLAFFLAPLISVQAGCGERRGERWGSEPRHQVLRSLFLDTSSTSLRKGRKSRSRSPREAPNGFTGLTGSHIIAIFPCKKKKKKEKDWGQMICTRRMRGEALCEMSSDRKRSPRQGSAVRNAPGMHPPPSPPQKITQFSCYCGLGHLQSAMSDDKDGAREKDESCSLDRA